MPIDVRRQAARVQRVVHPPDEHRQDQELRRGRGRPPLQSGRRQDGRPQRGRQTGKAVGSANFVGFPSASTR